MANAQITIDIADWLDEAMHEEVDFESKDALLAEHIKNKRTPLKSGRLAIAARQAGKAPDDILPANKLLLNTGAAVDIMQTFVRRYRQSKANGAYQVREFVGAVRAFDECEATDAPETEPGGELPEPQTYIESSDPEAAQRAEDYLSRVVPGHVWSRLLILAEQGGDVQGVAARLCECVMEMVTRLEVVAE
jgi:hypothetical protein